MAGVILSCCKCGRELEPPADRHYAQVTGWERPGRGLHSRSGSSLVLRQRTGQIACAMCIAKLASGVAVEQLTFDRRSW